MDGIATCPTDVVYCHDQGYGMAIRDWFHDALESDLA